MVFSYTKDGKSNEMDSVAVCIKIFLRCREKWPRCWRLRLRFRAASRQLNDSPCPSL